MASKLGCHWQREHPDRQDMPHIEAMQYKSVKLFKNSWDNADFCRDLLTVLPGDSYILARDHALSEQKEDMWRDAVAAGIDHANQWINKVHSGEYHLPTDRTFFLGINEPDATNGDRNKIDLYTESFLNRLRDNGLRGGAFNFSTGHPRTVDGTPNTSADYSVFERSHQAIVAGHHIGVLHIYGTGAVPCAPGHYDRLKACDWLDVEWVVGECAVDEHVIGGGEHFGYQKYFEGHLNDYCAWIDTLILGVNDSRIHSYQVFTYDFAHPWSEFDTHPIRPALESYPWRHMQVAPTFPTTTPPFVVHLPSITVPPQTRYVNVPSGLHLRSEPDVKSTSLDAAPYGDAVEATGISDDGKWGFVEYHDKAGWMYWQFLSDIKPDIVTTEPLPPIISSGPTPAPSGDNWPRIYAFIKKWEGGWADNPADPGGATNKGVTFGTYTRWREAHGQPAPTKNDLRNLTDAEAERIFHDWYYVASGSDKLPWPLSLANTDTAVNAGVGQAQKILAESGGNFLSYVGHLIQWYSSIPNFETFGRAWMNRRGDLLVEASKP